jgi:hypothetical protein
MSTNSVRLMYSLSDMSLMMIEGVMRSGMAWRASHPEDRRVKPDEICLFMLA